MKNMILVKAYTFLNVGDDLYLHILFDRYKNEKFEVEVTGPGYLEIYKEVFKKYDNVSFKLASSSFKERLFKKFGKITISKAGLKKYKAFIYIGGSIFMENPSDSTEEEKLTKKVDYFSKRGKPVFIISCNFGPYMSEGYLARHRELFKKCESVIFRDTYSYNLFCDIPNASYCPDAVFSLKVKDGEKIKNSIGISVIDIDRRNIDTFQKQSYKKFIKDLIIECLNQNKKVWLFSFCDFEGDGKAISEILDENLIKKVNIVCYDGKMDEFMATFKKMEEFVATRFHSLVLSLLLKQKVGVISYSQKIDNVLYDLSVLDKYIKVTDINNITPKEFLEGYIKEPDLSKTDKTLNCCSYLFVKLDNFIKTN